MDEIIKEAALQADVQGRTQTAADPNLTINLSQWFDIEEQRNAPIIYSTLDAAIAEVDHAAAAIRTGVMCDNSSFDVHMHNRKEYTLEIWVADDCNDGVLNSMQNSVRQFLVSSILAKWASLTYPDVAEYWSGQREKHLEAIRSAHLHCQRKKITVRKYPAW